MLSHEFHPDAERELEDELTRLREGDQAVSIALNDEVFAGVDLLCQHPEAGPVIRRRYGVRKKVLTGRFRFNLIYTIEPGRILIIAVAHQKRRPGYWAYRLRNGRAGSRPPDRQSP